MTERPLSDEDIRMLGITAGNLVGELTEAEAFDPVHQAHVKETLGALFERTVGVEPVVAPDVSEG